MTPARRTTGIVVGAAAVAVAASLLTIARPGGPAQAAPGGPLLVRAQLSSSHVLVGESETHMAITVRAPEQAEPAERPPINLAIVIDRSGSMSGEKLAHAKAAARQLVQQLDGRDRVAVVSYGSDVEVVFRSRRADGAAKSAALAAIDAIHDDGGTNLSGGLEAGRDEILASPEGGAVSRVVLISDGLANEGITDPDALANLARAAAERGVSITTVGVGLDFDERTMTRIAVAGAGNYYFVEDARMLATMFSEELGKLGATVATDVRVAIDPAPGVEIVEAYGYEIERDGGRAWISVADLHAGETRKVVLRVRVRAERAGGVDVARVEVGYRPVDGGEPRSVELHSRAEATHSQQAVLDGRDKDATRHIERARTALALDEATALYERGDYAGAKAKLERRRAEAKRIAADLGDEELAAEMEGATGRADAFMQAAPAAAGASGKRATKSNRKAAYDLMY